VDELEHYNLKLAVPGQCLVELGLSHSLVVDCCYQDMELGMDSVVEDPGVDLDKIAGIGSYQVAAGAN
jgi:hypothetical protein